MEVPNGDQFKIVTVLVEFFGIIGYALAVNMDDGTHIVALLLFTMMVCTQGISGGHLNPAVTLGVYIERNKFCSYGFWATCIIIFQMIGAFGGLAFGWILRVTMPVDGEIDEFYFVPGQYPFYPKIIDECKGLPAYGQVFLAELLGSIVLVLVILNVKDDIYNRDLNPIYYPICATASQIGLSFMFAKVSGGIFNPAVALSQIVWQNLTYKFEVGADQSYWTPEYATCYVLAPMVGAFMAGNVFGY